MERLGGEGVACSWDESGREERENTPLFVKERETPSSNDLYFLCPLLQCLSVFIANDTCQDNCPTNYVTTN